MFLSWEWPKAEIPYNICDLILNSIDNNLYKKGEVLDSDVQPIRDVNIQFNNINWINALLSGYIRYANYENFHYDLSDYDKESVQISKYSEGEFYGIHRDYDYEDNFTITRKLSLTVQLSDENDYEGGDLVFHTGNSKEKATRGRGSVVVFDSRVYHEVTPVTKGTRYSLVKWYHGDKPLR